METATDEEKCIIFDEIHQYAASLMTDLFGNYVIQKIFEFGLAYQVSYLVSIMKGNILTLCFQTYGCRVVQKAIENISPEDQVGSFSFPLFCPLSLFLFFSLSPIFSLFISLSPSLSISHCLALSLSPSCWEKLLSYVG